MTARKSSNSGTKKQGGKAVNLNGTDYDRFAMNGGGIKPAGAGSSYVKSKGGKKK